VESDTHTKLGFDLVHELAVVFGDWPGTLFPAEIIEADLMAGLEPFVGFRGPDNLAFVKQADHRQGFPGLDPVASVVGSKRFALASAELERDHARLRAGHRDASMDRRHRASQVEDSVGDPTAVDTDTREDRPGLGKLHVGARVDLDDEVLVEADLA